MPTLTVMRSDNIEFIGFALVYSVHRICSPSKLKGQLQLIKNLASLNGYLWNSPEADPGWGPQGVWIFPFSKIIASVIYDKFAY